MSSASTCVICAGAGSLRNSDFVLQATACGCSSRRILQRQILSNLRPVLYEQFLISIPVFILTEANLGILGLGVSEPLPSRGGLLRELEYRTTVQANPARLAPLLLLFVVVNCFQLVTPQEDFTS